MTPRSAGAAGVAGVVCAQQNAGAGRGQPAARPVLPDDGLLLVNASHPLPRGFAPAQLAPALPGFEEVLLQRQAAGALTALLQALQLPPRQILPVSGYRPHAEQQQIWDETLRDKGAAFTHTYVALPGCSEHETGLAIDLALNRPPVDFIRPHFPRRGCCGQFRRRAAEYGFIERYPAGKQQVTGIGAEPWHFRYVGAPHAAAIASRGLALEEYLQLLDPGGGGAVLTQQGPGGSWQISALPPDPELPKRLPGQLPGGACRLCRTGAGFWVLAVRRGAEG